MKPHQIDIPPLAKFLILDSLKIGIKRKSTRINVPKTENSVMQNYMDTEKIVKI